MRFAFTDDHVAFRDAVRDLLDAHGTTATVRAAWDAAPGSLDRSLWSQLTEMGALDVLTPEASGGLGLDTIALVGILEETGRAAVPHPVVESAALAAPLLADGLGGRLVAGSWRGAPVPCGLDADLVVVVGDADVRAHDPASLGLEAVDAVDRGRRLARITGSLDGGELLTDDPTEVAAAFDRAALGVAAQLVGLGDTLLRLTVEHVVDRRQFGVPVGSFQAVKHHLADALMELSFARPAVHEAAHAIAVGSTDVSYQVARAKVLAGEASEVVGAVALQCHGAIGYTVEHDLHLYLKRTLSLSRAWGDRHHHTEQVALARLGA